jgi:hypothetical protein
MGEETAMDGWEKDDGRRERKKIERRAMAQ